MMHRLLTLATAALVAAAIPAFAQAPAAGAKPAPIKRGADGSRLAKLSTGLTLRSGPVVPNVKARSEGRRRASAT